MIWNKRKSNLFKKRQLQRLIIFHNNIKLKRLVRKILNPILILEGIICNNRMLHTRKKIILVPKKIILNKFSQDRIQKRINIMKYEIDKKTYFDLFYI